jgi:selenoprotein W-related protein
LATELLEKFEPEIETLTLIPSDEGRFEVDVNDLPIFSKLNLKRHAEPGEISGLIKKLLEK